MRFKHYPTLAILLSAVMVFTAGCGRDKKPAYVESEEIPAIQVPPDLTQPETSREFTVPGFSLPQLAGHRDTDRPPRVLPSDEAREASSRVRSGPTGLYLEVDDEIDSVFQRLGLALNRDDMRVLNVDGDGRRYTFRYDHDPEVERRRGIRRMAFWRRPEVTDHSGDYQVRLEAAGRRTRVHILGREGGVVDVDPAEAVLEVLQDRLG